MSHLQFYKPFADLCNLTNTSHDLDDYFNRVFRNRKDDDSQIASWYPTSNIYEDDKTIKIHVELAGLKKEDVKINIQNNVLTISGEKKVHDEKKKENYHRIESSFGNFSRSFTLSSDTVDVDKVNATMKDGVLEISLNKKEEAKPKQVEIKVT